DVDHSRSAEVFGRTPGNFVIQSPRRQEPRKGVDFRFGSFTSFLPSRQVRFAPRADIRPMPAFMSVRPTARPKINLLKSRRSARAGCSTVSDSTRAAWYPSLYAPRAGGAYDGHHRTAGIAGRTLFFSSRRRHTRLVSDWSSDVCSSD